MQQLNANFGKPNADEILGGMTLSLMKLSAQENFQVIRCFIVGHCQRLMSSILAIGAISNAVNSPAKNL